MDMSPNFVEAFVLEGLPLSKLATVIYPPCFKKRTLELLLYLSFKIELPTNGYQNISLLVLKNLS